MLSRLWIGFLGVSNLYVDTENFSTLSGSKVKAHYVAVAAILNFAL